MVNTSYVTYCDDVLRRKTNKHLEMCADEKYTKSFSVSNFYSMCVIQVMLFIQLNKK